MTYDSGRCRESTNQFFHFSGRFCCMSFRKRYNRPSEYSAFTLAPRKMNSARKIPSILFNIDENNMAFIVDFD